MLLLLGFPKLRRPGFSLQWLLLLWSVALDVQVSVVVQHGFSCPDACAVFLGQGWNKPLYPALASGFSATGPPGKSQMLPFLGICCVLIRLLESLSPSQPPSRLPIWMGVALQRALSSCLPVVPSPQNTLSHFCSAICKSTGHS